MARQLRTVRWGLVPSWSRDARGGARMIHEVREDDGRENLVRDFGGLRKLLTEMDLADRVEFDWGQAA